MIIDHEILEAEDVMCIVKITSYRYIREYSEISDLMVCATRFYKNLCFD